MKTHIIEGQMGLFDLPIQESKEVQVPRNTKKINKPVCDIEKLINMYGDTCKRIVLCRDGAVLVGMEEKTMYFNKDTKHEFDLGKDIGLIPGDKILICNKDIPANNIQMEKLKSINPDKYIKRKGDANIIIPYKDKTISINPLGWVLEWKQKPEYKDDEIFDYVNQSEENHTFKLGEKVKVDYGGVEYYGTVERIYNDGDTLNVACYENGEVKFQTAFYYKCVYKFKN